VLDESKKFLLGEFHGSGIFEQESEHWPVTKMTEGFKRIPREAEDAAGIFEKTGIHPLPIDNAHAYLFLETVTAMTDLETLLARIDQDKADDRAPTSWTRPLKDVLEQIKAIRILDQDNYKPFLETFEKKFAPTLKDSKTKKRLPTPPRLGKIRALSTKLRKSWTGPLELGGLEKSLGEIKKVLDATRLPRKGWSARFSAAIRRQHSFLAGLATDLVPIIAGSNAQEAKALSDLINAPLRDPSPVLSPIRERTMAESIRAQAAPVLVQLGAAHVDPVAKLVGSDAVPVNLPKKLSDLTKRN
jgi:hypothetical protein